MKVTRRKFLESSATAVAVAGTVRAAEGNSAVRDGPPCTGFSPIPLRGNIDPEGLSTSPLSEAMRKASADIPRGSCVCWGIPFDIGRVIVLRSEVVSEKTDPLKAQWLVFQHTADLKPPELNKDGFTRAPSGEGRLAEHLADYVVVYSDGSEVRQSIRRRYQVGTFNRRWGENCFEAVAHRKPYSTQPIHERVRHGESAVEWGEAETRVNTGDFAPWVNWLWAWENPHPDKSIVGLRFEPAGELLMISAVSAGAASAHPLRWEARRKAVLNLAGGVSFDFGLKEGGLLDQIQIDLGQVISAEPLSIYPESDWETTYSNRLPERSKDRVLIEYTAHPDAHFHLGDGSSVPVSLVARQGGSARLVPVQSATRRVRLRVLDKRSRLPVPVRLHAHGASGEYLAPKDRHRLPNGSWFEDYSPEFQNRGLHRSVYIPGETLIDLPVGKVYLEVSKGFEIKPIRRIVEVGPGTEQIELELEKVLPWRERGWVTADTHVHFLSPSTAWLEGSAEGVNVVNLLASQWGELMTNVGDFDGRMTHGSKEAGGDGEWLVRVGTENRQHVLGHISLLGYRGQIIAPMCSGGPDEAALGDPVDVLLMEWAERCRAQGGLVVLPHFPDPRCENAAALINGVIDAVEMTSWGNLYFGIDPYALSDYYRYLNCGYLIAAVGGTDKMSATTAVGTVRTYARIPDGTEFNYASWLEAVRAGHTFVSYGPLVEFDVEGKPPGSRINLGVGGGTLDLTWELASVTIPMTRLDLVVNGEIRESRSVKPDADRGSWSVRVDQSGWLALLIRGHYDDKPEMIAAHSSPIMVHVENSDLFAPADALTMLDQIEGAMVYLDTIGTRAEDAIYRRMRLRLTSAHRKLHNELHRRGYDHKHSAGMDHSEHH